MYCLTSPPSGNRKVSHFRSRFSQERGFGHHCRLISVSYESVPFNTPSSYLKHGSIPSGPSLSLTNAAEISVSLTRRAEALMNGKQGSGHLLLVALKGRRGRRQDSSISLTLPKKCQDLFRHAQGLLTESKHGEANEAIRKCPLTSLILK